MLFEQINEIKARLSEYKMRISRYIDSWEFGEESLFWLRLIWAPVVV